MHIFTKSKNELNSLHGVGRHKKGRPNNLACIIDLVDGLEFYTFVQYHTKSSVDLH